MALRGAEPFCIVTFRLPSYFIDRLCCPNTNNLISLVLIASRA
jgi:hypothetical protein